MRVLLSAFACSPFLGSEGYVGWTAALTLARSHEVWAFTFSRFRDDLERARAEGLVPASLTFVYVGTFGGFHPNRLLARGQDWYWYQSWTRAIRAIAVRWHRDIRFDVIHHVTCATWRVPVPLAGLGPPFIWGPLGGGEHFPFRFLSELSRKGRVFELLRSLSNAWSRQSRAVRSCARQAARVVAANGETRAVLAGLRGRSEGVVSLSQAFFSESHVTRFRAADRPPRSAAGPLRIFAGGNLEARKGVSLALRALARAKAAGVDFRYHFGGDGPERAHLESLAVQFGLAREVVFSQGLGGDAYVAELQASDLYLLPSLRESAGLTLMEAMLAGCVPIVLRSGGPAEIVTPACGFALAARSPDEAVSLIAETVIALDRERALLAPMARAASDRIATEFSERHYLETIDRLYREVILESEMKPRMDANGREF